VFRKGFCGFSGAAPVGRTCRKSIRRRLGDLEEQGAWNIWRTFLNELNERQQLKWSESFLDGNFTPAKRALRSRKNQVGQGDEVVVVDSVYAPLGDLLHSAFAAEVRLAETVLATRRVLPVCSSWP
jgi:hypothetical protein